MVRTLFSMVLISLLHTTGAAQGSWSFNNPQPTGQTLSDIERTQDGVLWTVGAYGTLMKSQDDGQSWTTQRIDVTGNLNSIKFVGSHAWIVGNSGLILYSSNAGVSWSRQSSGSMHNLHKIQFLDEHFGWVLATDSVYLHTTNGGETWSQRRFDTQLPLNDLRFISPQKGWLTVGYYDPGNIGYDEDARGMLLHTTDGGATWLMIDSGRTKYGEISFVDTLHGWIAKRPIPFTSDLIHTTDGGLTWNPTQSSGLDFDCLLFTNTLVGWGVAYGSWLFTTSDGGSNWSVSDTIDYNYGFCDVLMSGSTQGWVVGTSGIIRATTNGGLMWRSLDKRLDIFWGALRDVAFCNKSEGWIGGDQYLSEPLADTSLVLHTSNGGKTWERKFFPHNSETYGIYALWAISNERVWVISDTVAVVTTDEGSTWTVANVHDHFRDIYFHNASSGFLLADRAVYKTSNGGSTWVRKTGFNNILFLRTLDFADSLRGWIVAHPGIGPEVTFLTTDGGDNWALSSLNFSTIDFSDSENGWALGEDKHVFRTRDGGRTWNRATIQPLTFTYWTSNIVMADTTTGWIWDSFATYRTTDGGHSWRMEPGVGFIQSGIDHGFYVVSRDLAWYVGGDGKILKYEDISMSVPGPIKSGIPTHILLHQNYPNPFNATTTIAYNLPRATHVSLKVYDALGQEVVVLVNEKQNIGERVVRFDASNLASGVYYCCLRSGESMVTRKMILMK